jgi:hypothetical protein
LGGDAVVEEQRRAGVERGDAGNIDVAIVWSS